MSAEAIRITADAFGTRLAAFNALLATVPRDQGEDAPPPIMAVYDRSRHGWVARNEVPREGAGLDFPALVVSVPDADNTEPSPRIYPHSDHAGHSWLLRGSTTVTIQYLEYRTRTELAVAASSYTLRAVRGWLIALTRRPVRDRARNGVELVDLTSLRQLEIYDPRMSTRAEDRQHLDGVFLGGVIATWSTRETFPEIAATAFD